jgi:hypothetical protein
MKIKKTISEKVILANRENATHSTGPRSTEGRNAVRHNALKHGLLAKQLVFRDEKERADFEQLLDRLEQNYRPQDEFEWMTVEEAGISWWIYQSTLRWGIQESAKRYGTSLGLLRKLTTTDEDQFGMFGYADPTIGSWECDEFTVRSSKEHREEKEDTDAGEGKRGGRVEIEARVRSSTDSVLRVQARVKRDFYKAIDKLLELQDRRSKLSPPPAIASRKKRRS